MTFRATALMASLVALTVRSSADRPIPHAPPAARLLVSAAWVQEHLHDRDLVILHVGDPKQFAAGHLPGARPVTLGEISVSDTSGVQHTMLQMPSAEALKDRLESLGISDRSQIVIYAAQQYFTPATRVLLTLDYAGLGDRATILDGGLDAWKKDAHSIETGDAATPARGSLSALKLHPFIVDATYVGAHLNTPGFVVVDARNRGYYDGVMVGGGGGMAQHLKGHIAGARSIPFTEVWTDSSFAQSPTNLRSAFARAGVAPTDTIIAYCHIGQQATSVIFAARLIGQPFKFYDGSFEDWSRQPNAKVETTPRP
ncbi:MAG: rhodanese-like domain-containing protein [Gemmatimonadaceae bacterium]